MSTNRTTWICRFKTHSAALLQLLSLCLVCSLLSGTAISQVDASLQLVRQRGELVWGADQEGGGPYVYPQPDKPEQLMGFEVEIAAELARRLQVKGRFQQGQWDKLPDLLSRGDIDIVLNGFEWTKFRSERFGCSLPYYIYELQLLTKHAETIPNDWTEFFRSRDSGQPRIGVLGGSAAHEFLEMHYGRQVQIVQFEGSSEAMRAVELGIDGVDATLQDLPIWQFFKTGFPMLAPVGHPVGRGYYTVLTRRDDRQLLQAINQAIVQMMLDGTLQRILLSYDLWNTTQADRALTLDSQGGFVGSIPAETANSTTPGNGPIQPINSFQAVRGWAVVAQRAKLLLKAAGITVLLAVFAMPLAVFWGMILAVVRLYGWRWASWIVQAYIELIRGTPLVLQLYVLFFLLPELGLSIHAFWAGVLGLAINYSAYEAEIYRAGIGAIPQGQWEAATALGMSRWLSLQRIILPQATRLVIPPVTNDFIALFKDTAVCSVITVVELSKEYSIHARSTGAIVELGIFTALLYLAMSFPLSRLASSLEHRLGQAPSKS